MLSSRIFVILSLLVLKFKFILKYKLHFRRLKDRNYILFLKRLERIEKLNQFMNAALEDQELIYQEGPAMGGQVGTKIATIMYLEVFYALVTQFEAAPA